MLTALVLVWECGTIKIQQFHYGCSGNAPDEGDDLDTFDNFSGLKTRYTKDHFCLWFIFLFGGVFFLINLNLVLNPLFLKYI